MKQSRLDIELARRHLVASRSQAESWIKLGKVMVNGLVITKTGYKVGENDEINLLAENQYVSRAGLKLESVSDKLKLDFKNKIVLDVGSSTGGFTEFSLKNGAKKVIAVDVGTDQLHPSLRANPNIELHEKTDIRDVVGPIARSAQKIFKLMDTPDIILIDVSFISQREILPHIFDNLAGDNTLIISMAKPQFEAGKNQTSRGVIKNDSVRRNILSDFELWLKKYAVIIDKHDSEVAGAKGNRERFYLLKPVKH